MGTNDEAIEFDEGRTWTFATGAAPSWALQAAIDQVLSGPETLDPEEQSSQERVLDLTRAEPRVLDPGRRITVTYSGQGHTTLAVDILIQVGTGISAEQAWDVVLTQAVPLLYPKYGRKALGPRKPAKHNNIR